MRTLATDPAASVIPGESDLHTQTHLNYTGVLFIHRWEAAANTWCQFFNYVRIYDVQTVSLQSAISHILPCHARSDGGYSVVFTLASTLSKQHPSATAAGGLRRSRAVGRCINETLMAEMTKSSLDSLHKSISISTSCQHPQLLLAQPPARVGTVGQGHMQVNGVGRWRGGGMPSVWTLPVSCWGEC